MKDLKNYKNLHEMYRKVQRKWLIGMIGFFVLFLLSFVFIFLDLPFDLAMIMMLMIIPTIGAAIIYLGMRIITARSLNRFTQEELARIDSSIPMAQMQNGFCVTYDAVVCSKGKCFLYPVRDILWVYGHVLTTRLYGVIPIGRDSFVVIAGKDHKRYTCRTKNKSNVVDNAVEFLKAGLSQYRKGIFYGYSADLDTMFQKDFNRMLTMSREYDMQNT
ncbi:MAG: hypothetical protein J1E65_09130 [Lachnospiraceae bacterium]|nr:hypothetical protein [Lachnospiraceae bacterium]